MVTGVFRSLSSIRLGSTLTFTRRHTLSHEYTASYFSTDGARSTHTSDSNALSVAIVGSGPSGCYTAKYLTSQIRKEHKDNAFFKFQKVEIDMLDQLPTPFGLVRNGVAPDHPEVKNVEHDFSMLFQKEIEGDNTKDLLSSSIAFRGNLSVGKDISLKELSDLYDVIVLAYGCESDRTLSIPGSDLEGILSAREFVNFYNGHVEYTHLAPLLEKSLKSHVVVIGQGNVALDCARICAKGKRGLMDTDITTQALGVLGDGVMSTTVVGRRGHVQGAFTIKELRELTKMQEYDTTLIVRQEELDRGMTEATQEELTGRGSRPKVRINNLLQSVAMSSQDAFNTTGKSVELRFLLNPIEFKPHPLNPTKLGSIICERTRLEGHPGQQQAVGTGELIELPANLALVSIGYKGLPLPSIDARYFNSERGIYHHTCGKVHHSNGLYVSGWIKRGPMGIIGSNIVDAKDTVYSIVDDLKAGTVVPRMTVKGRLGLDELLRERGVEVVDWCGFEKIDAQEKNLSRRRSELQPREKITNRLEMVQIAQS